MSEIFVDDFGTVLRATLGANITGNTERRLDITKPDLTTLERPATVEDILLGIIYYTTVSGDFDQEGLYCIVPFIKFGASKEFRGKALKINVTTPCA